MKFERVLIIGLGVMGASIAAALHKRSAQTTVYGWDNNPKASDIAVQNTWIDPKSKPASANENDAHLATLLEGAQLIVIATPLSALPEVLQKLSQHAQSLSDDVLITDTLSVKGAVLEEVERSLASHVKQFVGSHPITGSELSGAANADAELFGDKCVMITPQAQNSQQQIQALSKWWNSVGAYVVERSAKEHDEILAHTSHLPHMAVYALVHQFDKTPELLDFSGGGLRDTTRIAAANPKLWSEISTANREYLLLALDAYMSRLKQCAEYLRAGDEKGLRDMFTRAQQIKQDL